MDNATNAPQSPIMAALDKADKMQAAIFEQLSMLRDRLRPVSSPDAPTPEDVRKGDKADVPKHSVFARIEGQTARLDSILQVLNRITGNLEV